MFTDAVAVQTSLSQGCSPIGPHRTITEAQRNVLVTLDGRPALDVFKEDIGEILSRDIARVGGYIFAGLPIPGSDTGDYLVRNLIGVDLQQKLLAIGDLVEEGRELMFCRRDAGTAREDLSRMLAHLKARLSGPPRGGVYISCLGRGANLFGDDSEELKQIRDELGDFPLVGFYANGEVSQDRLYGYTGVLTLFL
jgi:small ligand-binding sensory domain FIST